jgi:hypothetical protein
MSVTKESILSATSSCEILNHYLARLNPSGQRLIPGKHISNPFLAEKQKTPSFNIYYSHASREWRFKDFVTGDDGSGFDLVMRMYNLSFSDALQRINSDMCLNILEHHENSNFTPPLHLQNDPITYGTSSLIVRPFLPAELDWWKQYGISDAVLKQFRVRAVQSFSGVNKAGKEYKIDSSADNPVYAYVREQWAKLYRPLNTKYRFQYLGQKPSDYMFGLEQLPDLSEYIFLTGGEKDVMSLAAHDYSAVSLNSETAMLSPDALALLRSRCRFLIVLYDNDETGSAQGEKIARANNLPRLVLPTMVNGKDISDYFKLGLPVSDLQQLIDDACRKFEPLPAPVAEPSRLEKVLITREILAQNKSKKITFSNPILTQSDNPVFFPKTINVIQGKAGVHKSRLAQIISSAMLRKNGQPLHLLSFSKDNSRSYAICYVDTERNLSEQLPYALQQIQIRAGYNIEDHPENFDYISLLEFDRKERFDVLNEYLVYIRTKYNRHVFIILDVITDCVYNFNDAKDSMALIDMMNISINRYDVTFLCLIHENPGSTDKARGHLGTEIMNKASTVIQVGFERDHDRRETDLIKVTYLKCRSSKKHEPFYVKYSETENTLVLADADTIAAYTRDGKKRLDVNSVMDQLELILTKSTPRKEVLELLMEEFNCSERFIEDYLRQIFVDKSTMTDCHGRTCYLHKSRQNRAIHYSLQPVGEQQTEISLVDQALEITEEEAPF